jgi:hypothetical protein
MSAKNKSTCHLCDEIRKPTDNTVGQRIVALDRATLFIVHAAECILIARSHVSTPDEMRDGERTLFDANLTKSINAYQHVAHAESIQTEMTHHMGHLYVRLQPIQPQHQLEAIPLQTLIGDLREALGYIRDAVTEPLLQKYIDALGRIKTWPSAKYSAEQMAVRQYLASKFQPNVTYTEREVNALLNRWHLFEDWALLRRELIIYGFLGRYKDGTAYWLESYTPQEQSPSL